MGGKGWVRVGGETGKEKLRRGAGIWKRRGGKADDVRRDISGKEGRRRERESGVAYWTLERDADQVRGAGIGRGAN